MATIPNSLPADDTLTAVDRRELGRRLLRGGVWVVAGRGIGVWTHAWVLFSF